MQVSIESFGGNKDNYYNFKQSYLKAREIAILSQRYVDSEKEEYSVVESIIESFSYIEFED